VEVSMLIVNWNSSPFSPLLSARRRVTFAVRVLCQDTFWTATVKNNGIIPMWEGGLSLPFDCVGDMLDLIFVRFAVKQDDTPDGEPLTSYCTSLGSLEHGMHSILICLIGFCWIENLFEVIDISPIMIRSCRSSSLFVRITFRNV
jgi:phosphatidylinositol phospholipase C delta